MRTILISLVTGILTLAISYYVFVVNEPTEATQFRDTGVSASSDAPVLDAEEVLFLTARLEEYQQKVYDHILDTQHQQERFNGVLEHIEARLEAVETSANTQVSGADELNEEYSAYKAPKPAQVTDEDIGYFIDESLYAGYQNDGLTSLAADQVVANLDKVPGVSLDDMQCADRFCRATFSHVNGEQPEVHGLFGEPPFVNEGFTIVQPDGRVALYFNQPGESLSELRSEVGDSLGYWDHASEETSSR